MPPVSKVPNVSLLGPKGFSMWRIVRLGEPFIWLAGAALAVILFMITLMLALVLFEGAAFFWPRDLNLLTMKDGTVLAGQQRDSEVYEEKDDLGAMKNRIARIQIMAGNRDLNGQDFVWVDLDKVAKTERPLDVYYLERQEWGPMIAWAVDLRADGQTVKADEPAFRARLQRELSDGRSRHRAIQDIERDQIGELNRKIEAGRLRIRGLQLDAKRSGRPVDALAVAAVESKAKAYQTDFELLQGRLAELRKADDSHQVTFRAADGTTKTLPAGGIVRALQPNQLGFFGKIGVYLARLFEFVFGEPRESNTEGGVFPAIFGTVMMSLLMSILVVPFGVIAALYLREYAKQGPLVSAVRIAVNNLAGVPSIVFGVFGLGFFVYFLGGNIDRFFYPEALPTPTYGTGGILWASLTLALLTVPVVVVATEEALAFVPRGIRDGSLACGASKWQMIRTVVLPAAAPGILTGVILAMARGAGEVAPLMITGVVKLAPELPMDLHLPLLHLQRKFMHLGFHIYDVGFQSPNVEAAMPMVYTTTLLLIAVIVGLNIAAMLIRNHLRNKYKTSAF